MLHFLALRINSCGRTEMNGSGIRHARVICSKSRPASSLPDFLIFFRLTLDDKPNPYYRETKSPARRDCLNHLTVGTQLRETKSHLGRHETQPHRQKLGRCRQGSSCP